MPEKNGTIKNPLTIVGVFAGIVEISGTIVLPKISEANQELYIYFLIFFPVYLVTFFFYTLNKNHKVLYAPSDFKNDESFLNLIPATSSEKAEKLRKLSNENDNIQDNANFLEVDNLNSSQFIATDEADGKEVSKVCDNPTRRSRANYLLAEELALLKISQEIDGDLVRDMKYVSKRGRKIFIDGVITSKDKITFIEVKYIPNKPGYILTFNPIRNLIKSLEDAAPLNSTLIFVLVSEGTLQNPQKYLNNLSSLLEPHFRIQVIFKIFCLKELESEFQF